MATITLDGVRPETGTTRGFFARALERIGDAQMARARAIAKPHLLAMDEAELVRLGYNRDEIVRWPNGSAGWL
jgi:hypothetical protein